MTGFFRIGESYQGYLIKKSRSFLNGEIAISEREGNRFYLQYIPVQKTVSLQLIEQYLSLDHPLSLPHIEIYTEDKSLVFVRPYIEITQHPVDEKTLISWIKQLLALKSILEEKTLPMHLILHPENIGVTKDGKLKVLLCGTDPIMERKADWGSFIQALLKETEQISESMEWLIQKSSRSSKDLVSLIEKYEKKHQKERERPKKVKVVKTPQKKRTKNNSRRTLLVISSVLLCSSVSFGAGYIIGNKEQPQQLAEAAQEKVKEETKKSQPDRSETRKFDPKNDIEDTTNDPSSPPPSMPLISAEEIATKYLEELNVTKIDRLIFIGHNEGRKQYMAETQEGNRYGMYFIYLKLEQGEWNVDEIKDLNKNTP